MGSKSHISGVLLRGDAGDVHAQRKGPVGTRQDGGHLQAKERGSGGRERRTQGKKKRSGTLDDFSKDKCLLKLKKERKENLGSSWVNWIVRMNINYIFTLVTGPSIVRGCRSPLPYV